MEGLTRMPGSIVRIQLENFMTFSHCEFKPGPRLNVILGPNGSGKSSLVCALGLGLGGSPKILARSSNIKEFIKKGEKEAKIEIELMGRDGGPNVIVERFISGDGTRWRLDGKNVPEQRVQEKLKSMEIQVDNLVQFLPQDRVAEFAKLNEVQLLRETIRAVLGVDHLEQQERIAAQQKEMQRLSERLETKKAELEELQKENDRSKHAVTRQKERLAIIEEVKLLEIKLPWVRFEEAREEAIVLREELKKLEDIQKKGSLELQPLKDAMKESGKIADKAKTAADESTLATKNWAKKMADIQAKLNEDFERVDTAKTELLGVQKKREKFVKQVASCKSQIENLRDKVAAAKGDAHYDAALSAIKKRIAPVSTEHTDVSTRLASKDSDLKLFKKKRESIARKQSLQGASTLSNSRSTVAYEREAMAVLGRAPQMTQHQRQAMSDLRTKALQTGPGALFKKPVFGPLICELRGVDESASDALEQSVRASTWRFFVATCAEDHAKLTNDRVTSILIENIQGKPRRVYPQEVLDQLGIRGYLDDLVSGDPYAIEAARRMGNIHNVLVGSELTDKIHKENPGLFDKLLLLPMNATEKIILVTPLKRFDLSRSRYEGKVQTTKVVYLDVSRANLKIPVGKQEDRQSKMKEEAEKAAAERLKSVQEMQEIEATMVKLEEEVRILAEKDNELTVKLDEMKKEKAAITEEREAERKLMSSMRSAEERLEEAESNLNQDWDKLEAAEKEKCAKLEERIVGKSNNLAEISSMIVDLVKAAAAAQWSKAQAEQEKALIASLLQREEERVNSTQSELKKAKEKFEKKKLEVVDLKKKAEAAAPMTDDLAHLLEQIPDSDTPQQIEVAIEFKRTTLSLILEDPAAVERYQSNLAKIKELEDFMRQEGPQIQSRLEQLTVDVDNWKQSVLDMAGNINKRVKKFFAEIGKAGYACAGEVSLITPNPRDVSTYGMEIQVKFREGQNMGKLDPAVQSGGERSLTTFLYMLALQELSAVPFRVVDEINQGMDSDKERLAFYRMAEVSSNSTAQYFLATPKLLPGLAFPKDVTILFVFNGPYNLSQPEWDMKKFVELAKSKKRESTASTESTTDEGSVVTAGTSSKRVRATS